MSAQKDMFYQVLSIQTNAKYNENSVCSSNGGLKNAIRIDFLHRQYMKKYQKWGNFVHLDEQGNDVFLFYRKEI